MPDKQWRQGEAEERYLRQMEKEGKFGLGRKSRPKSLPWCPGCKKTFPVQKRPGMADQVCPTCGKSTMQVSFQNGAERAKQEIANKMSAAGMRAGNSKWSVVERIGKHEILARNPGPGVHLQLADDGEFIGSFRSVDEAKKWLREQK